MMWHHRPSSDNFLRIGSIIGVCTRRVCIIGVCIGVLRRSSSVTSHSWLLSLLPIHVVAAAQNKNSFLLQLHRFSLSFLNTPPSVSYWCHRLTLVHCWSTAPQTFCFSLSPKPHCGPVPGRRPFSFVTFHWDFSLFNTILDIFGFKPKYCLVSILLFYSNKF